MSIKYRLTPFTLATTLTFLLGLSIVGQAQTATTLYLPILFNGPDVPIPTDCPIFSEDHIWNAPVDGLPLDSNSDAYINSIGADDPLHPDFGSGTWAGFPIGIPYVIVSGTQPKVWLGLCTQMKAIQVLIRSHQTHPLKGTQMGMAIATC